MGTKNKGSNFLLLRVSAALFVVLGHSTVLLGRREPNFGIFGMGVHTFGLYLFFAVSGYLVTQSYRDTTSFVRFLIKRFFRIYPATLVMTLVTMLPLAIAVNSKFDPFEYLGVVENTYLLNLLFYPVFALPGVFSDNPVPNAVNGSLWSLPLEIACYLVLAFVLLLLSKLKMLHSKGYVPISIFLALAYFFSNSYRNYQSGDLATIVFWGSNWSIGFLLFATFFFACALNFAPDKYIAPSIAIILTISYLLYSSVYSQSFTYLSLVIAYTVISIGKISSKLATKISNYGDPTFGTYLWAFPIQQIIVQFFPTINFIFNFLVVASLSLLFGYLSFHLIEKRFISWGKNIKVIVMK